ncbi:MAG: YggT family protein [Chloroflexia bacterium]|nr:YggT family protein [Chloroflexia bacterium]
MQLVEFVSLLFRVFSLLLFGRAILSWFDPSFRTTIGQFIYQATEPLVGPVRQIMPRTGMFDFSIIITLVLLQVLQSVIISVLTS